MAFLRLAWIQKQLKIKIVTNLLNVTDERNKCESQTLRQLFWELTYGQAVYIFISHLI